MRRSNVLYPPPPYQDPSDSSYSVTKPNGKQAIRSNISHDFKYCKKILECRVSIQSSSVLLKAEKQLITRSIPNNTSIINSSIYQLSYGFTSRKAIRQGISVAVSSRSIIRTIFQNFLKFESGYITHLAIIFTGTSISLVLTRLFFLLKTVIIFFDTSWSM